MSSTEHDTPGAADPDAPDPDEPVLEDDVRAEMEDRLLRERDRAQEDLNTALEEGDEPPATSSGDLSDLPSHPADAATAAAAADTDFRVAEQRTERLNAVDDALHRLREHPGSYGACEVCGDPVALERLRIVPWTRRCADHAPESGRASPSS